MAYITLIFSNTKACKWNRQRFYMSFAAMSQICHPTLVCKRCNWLTMGLPPLCPARIEGPTRQPTPVD